jgi:peptidyl-prolyl cis-trans isomerase B (cyclophilin B)
MRNPLLIIQMASKSSIVIELMPDIAPNTVASVIWLAGKGLYDNRPFYRVVKDFVIQTGCSKEMDYQTGCEYIIESECVDSGFEIPQPSFEKYIVGMAGMGKGSNITSGSEFFIMTGAAPRLNGNFPVIGRVSSGFEEVDRINGVACSDLTYEGIKFYQPLEKEIMEKVFVETFGLTFMAPKTKPFPEGYLDEEDGINKMRKY